MRHNFFLRFFVKIGSTTAPDPIQAAKPVVFEGGSVYWPGNWFASLELGVSGPHTVRFRQAVVADGSTLLETWDLLEV